MNRRGSSRNSQTAFVFALSVTSIWVSLIQILRNSPSESLDKIIYAGAACVGAFTLLKTYGKTWPSINFITVSISLLSLALGIFGIEKHGTETTRGVDISGLLWLGFGPFVLIMCLLLLPWIFHIYRWVGLAKPVRLFLSLLAVLVSILVVPAIWQTNTSIIDVDSSEYVINENLAVAAGHLPYVDFIPQYGTLYAWLIAPFADSLNADQLVNLSLYLMNIATLIAILIGVLLVYWAMNKRSLALAALLVIPLTSIAQFPGRDVYSGTIYALLGGIASRVFPGVVIAALIISALSISKARVKTALSLIASFLAGLNIWHTLDFGFALLVTMALFSVFISSNKRHLALYFISMFIGTVIYPIVQSISGEGVNLVYFGIFILGFGSGFGAEPIITPGPVLVVLPLIAAISAVSSGILLANRFGKLQIEDHLKRSLYTASFFSVWSAFGFAYYLNRSYASGQMQILFLPLSIALASFAYYLMESHSDLTLSGLKIFGSASWNRVNRVKTLSALAVGLVLTIPIASTIAFPQPNIEMKRITAKDPNQSYPKKNVNLVKENYSLLKGLKPEILSELSYFGASSNYVTLSLDILSTNILNSPWDIPVTNYTVITGCEYLSEVGRKYLLLGDEAAALFRFENQSLCNLYQYIPLEGFPDGRLAIQVNG